MYIVRSDGGVFQRRRELTKESEERVEVVGDAKLRDEWLERPWREGGGGGMP
jgi:hypothetical protein